MPKDKVPEREITEIKFDITAKEGKNGPYFQYRPKVDKVDIKSVILEGKAHEIEEGLIHLWGLRTNTKHSSLEATFRKKHIKRPKKRQ